MELLCWVPFCIYIRFRLLRQKFVLLYFFNSSEGLGTTLKTVQTVTITISEAAKNVYFEFIETGRN